MDIGVNHGAIHSHLAALLDLFILCIGKQEAMDRFGTDKPDTRFGMTFHELNDLARGKGFNVFDTAQLVVGIKVEGAADWSRKQLDALTDFVRRPQIGAKGLVYVKCNQDGTYKSSVDKFFTQEDINKWAEVLFKFSQI